LFLTLPEKGTIMPLPMKPKERIMAAINHQESDHVPCNLTLSYFVARYNGITIEDYINDQDLCMELQHKTFEDLGGSDMVSIPPPCLGNSPESFAFLPVLVRRPGVELPSDIIPQYDETERMLPEHYDIVIKKGWFKYVEEYLVPTYFPDRAAQGTVPAKKWRHDDDWNRSFYEDKGVFLPPRDFIMLPFEVLSFARSMEKFMIDLFRRPDKVLAALDAVWQDIVESALSNIDAAADKVTIPANRFSGGFISPRHFEKFAYPQLLRAVNLLIDRGFTVFFHLDQNWTNMLPYFREFPKGKYVLHFDGTTDIFKAKEILGDRMCIMGDVPARLYKLGTPRDIETYCKKLIDRVGKGSGFILSAG
jgi:uroporphyrinogen-III decarboxylase